MTEQVLFASDMGDAIFFWELKRTGRGRWLQIARWSYGAWLAFLLLIAHDAYYSDLVVFGEDHVTAGATARFARQLVDTLIFQQTWVLLLLAPAIAGGAITDEKTKGTLEPLFLAHIGPSSIILGKFAARVAAGFLWSLAIWPVLALVGLPGGLTPAFFGALAVVTFFNLAGLCSLSLLASVWSRTTRSSVISVYIIIAMVSPIVHLAHQKIGAWDWVSALDPNFVLDAAKDQPDYSLLGRHLLMAVEVWSGITVVCTFLAIVRLKPAYLAQLRKRGKKTWYSFLRFRRAVADRSLQWKETYVGRWPSWPIWAMLALGGSLTVYAAHQINVIDDEATLLLVSLNWIFISVLVLAAGVMAADAITGERDQQTWDGLLSTPWHFSQILDGKCDGAMARIWPLYFAANISAGITESILRGGELLIGVLVSLLMAFVVVAVMLLSGSGIGLFPWGMSLILLASCANTGWFIAGSMWGVVLCGAGTYFMIRFGHYVSARSKSGWISLLATVVVGQLLMSVLIAGSSPISGLMCCVLTSLTWGPLELFGSQTKLARDTLFPIFWSAGWVIAWYWGGNVFYRWANAHLDRNERIPGHHVRMIDLDMPFKPPREEDDEM